MPQHERLTLPEYLTGDHSLELQVFIYPVDEQNSWNEQAGKQADELKALLFSQQVSERLPFLPLINAGQVLRAKVEFLVFKNGQGVRYLTQHV
jgi:hypothetical protein